MKKMLWLTAVAAAALAGSAQAAVITLQGIAANGPNDFTFTYQGTLGPDEGLQTGDRLIIYDFRGYIAGSVNSPFPQVTASVENTSTGLVTPGFADDPTLANLVFTYNGPDFRDENGPFPPIDFSGLSARSTLGGTTLSAFFTLTTKNNPDGVPGGSGTDVFTLGSVTTPAIPEPATWAMMVGGFGLAGFGLRRRGRMATVSA